MSNIDLLYDIVSGRKRMEDLSNEQLSDIQRSPAGSLQQQQPVVSAQPIVKPSKMTEADILKLPDAENVVSGTYPGVYHIPTDKISNSLPVTKAIVEGKQPVFAQKESEVSQAGEEYQKSMSNIASSREMLSDLNKMIQDSKSKKFDDSDYKSKMATLSNEYAKIQDPQRDFMSQAILALGPSLLAGLAGGESAALAAPKAQSLAQSQYEQIRKEDIVHNEKLRDNLSKRIDALAKMKEQDINLWDKQGKQEMDLIKQKVISANNQLKDDLAAGKITQKEFSDSKKQLDSMFEKTTSDVIRGEVALKTAGIRSSATSAPEKLLQKLGDDIDPNRARSGELGAGQKRLNAAQRILALTNNGQELNLNKMNTHELAIAVAGLIQGGSPYVSSIKNLVPSSLHGDIKGLEGWLTNKAVGTGQEDFVKSLVQTAIRERDVTEEQVRNAQISKLTKYPSLIGKPETKALYKSFGIDLDTDVKDGKWAGKKQVAPQGQSQTGGPPPGMSFEEFKKWKASQSK